MSTAFESLPPQIQQTVEDAIFAVTRLRRRYLWVDRYCIRMIADKHLQIQKMGLVYV